MSLLARSSDRQHLYMLYAWVDEIPLSRPKRNIARDFSDGVLTAEIVAHYFPKGANVLTKPAKTGKHPTWKAKGETPKVAEGTHFLTVAVPQSIQIVEDNHQARWRIICGSGEAKSVSWTKRGVRAASALSLYYAWDLHTAYTGEKPDFNKEGLLADAQKLGSEAMA